MQEGPLTPSDETRADPGRGRGSSDLLLAEAPRVPGYEIVRMVGHGGMGIVWEAFDDRLERRVALKVHSGGATPERVAQLWSEAKLAARIAHPGVVSVHDVGTTLDGQPYYTMDLVEGTSLREALRDGPFSQARALTLGAQIADAVAAAHEGGIVHCDLKPGNILLDASGRAKILDFGIAVRQGAQPDRLEVRGTPQYMSPEQLNAELPTVATDIYAIGVILYEMIAGQRPFTAASTDELVRAVLEQEPPPLSQHSPRVHTDVERVCRRCLQKRPQDRFLSAQALREAFTAILEGRPVTDRPQNMRSYVPRAGAAHLAPARPSRAEATQPVRINVSIAAPPERIWPFVADTDRFNKAVGLPVVEFTDFQRPEGYWARTGRLRTLGMDLVWDENPFEWIRYRIHSVFRSYRTGPLKALWNQVSLTPTDDGRTELVHEIWAMPSGVLGRVAVLMELELKTARRIEGFYRRLAAQIEGDARPLDYFEAPHRPGAAVREHVEAMAARLVEEHAFPAALVEKLTELLLEAPTQRIERLRPFALADAWGARREEVLELFLRAAGVGLVALAWDIVCPECRLPHEVATSLVSVAPGGECTSCGTTYERDLASSVELIFQPHRAIRAVTPMTYCVGAPARRPHVLSQQVLDPGELRTLTLDLDRGAYRLVASRAAKTWEFSASPAGVALVCSLTLTSEAIEARPLVVRAGPVSIELMNATAQEEIFRLESAELSPDGVTAALALNHPLFREYFSAELVASGEHLAVSHVAFLFVDVVERDKLFEQQSDPGALWTLDAVAHEVGEAVRARQGSITQIDAGVGLLVAAFASGVLALKAALAALERVHAATPLVKVRAGVHQGRCIAVTRDARVQYFGETLERGTAMLAASDPGWVAVSTAISNDPDVARLILATGLERSASLIAAGRDKGRRFTRLRARPG